ncbi:hypothetical protein BO70DRAFT_426767 [Aspergillus heteromorphus CBS 117.55]|uniref:Uncharacterized protein n=1 Tax=Aspergillus heteromorphus CBS 117.55 TaxID=1448321 RepID=A0A317WTH5_9EURO|nr:uncharacterized protein BO70DRAFT_426767 [Aspergillus heteromorphus CBS 117.55]PWY89101.1 hypothetical protein BO70DRAFT_426767 [Aspergillus heteromorphus CBS 117.55]
MSFFDDYPAFKLDPSAPITAEFKRLANQRHWKKGSKTWRNMWNRFTTMEYEELIGNHLAGLDGWRDLCEELDLPGPFDSIRQCKKALSKVHVNIVDVLESRLLDRKPRKFPNKHALAAYTRDSGKFMSRDLAKQDGLLKVLLRRLL